ncbi:TRAP transporter substrate-binding protein DctP [Skermanella sp. TT6]|uniref:TRAP transporter substrate-binding protein DctP n=1 Tax=Skermanella cutis TaxID=2775420 RepID=A0ABX7BD86_9PROT|nr:TRAP transporter substrate-binding protein DctP [Skermanella sp. TT6]QQP92368.1 TRAP transporter substrate-binding protein DctP [Skermanella sp. TT6]
MKRRDMLVGGLAGASAAAAAVAGGPAPAQAQSTEINWRMTSSYPASLDAVYGAGDTFIKVLGEISDGRMRIQHFAAGEIVGGFQALDAVQNGTVECCDTAPFYYVGKDPSFAFGASVPFGLSTRQQNAWFFQAGGLELLNELFNQHNVVGIPIGNTNAQMAGWFRKEIKSVDDLKGLKMRIGGLAGQVIAKLGAVPQQIPAGDIYPALERGTIDAAEWVGPYDDERLGFAKVAPYYYYPGWWEGASAIFLFINKDRWEALKPLDRAQITAAAHQANTLTIAKYDQVNPGAIRRLVAAGAQLRAFPPEVMEACLKAANEVFAEISAQNPLFKRLHDHMTAFRNEQYLWQQIAEYSYETFMIRARGRG